MRPDWNRLRQLASEQEGHFTTAQAGSAGFSSPLLARHLGNGRITRIRRGVYRLTHYPPGDREELCVAWLWSDRRGVFSHETALELHGLGDVMPRTVHLTVPSDWRIRRLRVPDDLTLHFADVRDDERSWHGAVPITSVRRTLFDCVAAHVEPDVLLGAATAAIDRGLVDRSELAPVLDDLDRHAR